MNWHLTLARKSYCIAFGKLTVKHDIEPMSLVNDNIQWVSSFKYMYLK